MSVTNIGKSCATHEQIGLFKQVFTKQDTEDELLVFRDEYIDAALVFLTYNKKEQKDVQINAFLDEPCMIVPILQKQVSFRIVIEQLRQYAPDPEIPFNKKSEFLTWGEIEDAFLRFRDIYIKKAPFQSAISNQPGSVPSKIQAKDPNQSTINSKSNNGILKSEFPNQQTQTLIGESQMQMTGATKGLQENQDGDIDNMVLIKDVFDTVDRILKDYVYRDEFVEVALRDPRIRLILNDPIRIPEKSEKGTENVKQVMIRIGVEAEEKICWDDVLGYFTPAGRPVANNNIKPAPWKVLSQNEWIGEYPLSYAEKLQQAERQNQEIDQKLSNHNNFMDNVTGTKRSSTGIGSGTKSKNGFSQIPQSDIAGVNRGYDDDLYTQGIVDKEGNSKQNKLWRNKEFTVPKGPKMLERDKRGSIREQKLKKMIDDKEAEQKKTCTFQPAKPQPVPFNTEAPRQRAIEVQTEQKRMSNVAQTAQETLNKAQAFSFYERDKTAHMERMAKMEQKDPELEKKFVSKALPSMYANPEQIEMTKKRKEIERAKATEEHKALLIAASIMPSRMGEAEKNNPSKTEKIEKLKKELFDKDHSFNPKIEKKVPDANKQYEIFQSKLEKVKQEKPKTEIQEFKISTITVKQKNVEEKKKQEELEIAQKKAEENPDGLLPDTNVAKLKKAVAINTFLTRNFLPSEKKQAEGKEQQAKKQEDKLLEKAKMTENKKKKQMMGGIANLLGGFGIKAPANGIGKGSPLGDIPSSGVIATREPTSQARLIKTPNIIGINFF